MKQSARITNPDKDPRFNHLVSVARTQMRRLNIPGIQIGVVFKNKEYYAGLGVTSIENPLPITEETLFEIASVSKTFLVTAIMRLVDAGKINLDAPIRKYLPELKLKDRAASEQVTMRHLLTHTGGWLGDYFKDFGSGDDALEKMVDCMRHLPQVSPLGKIWSYNNSGFYLAGRVIEKVTGKTFENALTELVFDPLGMKKTFFSTREIMTHRFAVGHRIVKGENKVARPYGMDRASTPAGGIVSNAKDLMAFARFHMGEGSISGKKLISERGMLLMHSPKIGATVDKQMAFAWFVLKAGEYSGIWHGGSLNGQKAELLVVPDNKFALSVCANSDYGGEACAQISKVALMEYCEHSPAQPKQLKLANGSVQEYLGKYELPVFTCQFRADKKGLLLEMKDLGGFPPPPKPPTGQMPPARVVFYEKDRFMGIESPYKALKGEFLRSPEGKIEWLKILYRAHKRVK